MSHNSHGRRTAEGYFLSANLHLPSAAINDSGSTIRRRNPGYKATDTRLDRTVAIKVPGPVGEHPDFEVEENGADGRHGKRIGNA